MTSDGVEVTWEQLDMMLAFAAFVEEQIDRPLEDDERVRAWMIAYRFMSGALSPSLH